MTRVPRLLVEGRPGTGKTTVARQLVALLRDRGVPVAGFFTGEIREGSRRVGFGIETLGGDHGVLAHVDLRGSPRVGGYGVDLEAFERLALPELDRIEEGTVAIVDELGKMELFSERFRDAIARLFEDPVPVAATVHVHRHPFTDALKDRPDVRLIRLTRESRARLPSDLAAALRAYPGAS